MINIKAILFSLTFVLVVHISYAQKWKLTRYEVGAGIGTANYFGDIGGSADKANLYGIKDISFRTTGPSLYTSARFRINPSFTAKACLIYGFIIGSDIGSKNEARAFKFRTNALEYSAQVEYSLISDVNRSKSFARFSKKGMLNSQSLYNVYVFAGVGGLLYSPNLTKDDKAVTNYPGTTGYNNNSLVIPTGIGIKMNFLPRIGIGAEFGGRYTFTDYLDGYKSVYSKFNDVYYFFSASIYYKLRTGRKGGPILFPYGVPDWLKFGRESE